jgi:predicted ABC-class ATPase
MSRRRVRRSLTVRTGNSRSDVVLEPSIVEQNVRAVLRGEKSEAAAERLAGTVSQAEPAMTEDATP